MSDNITFSMIKPHAIHERHLGEIITMIERSGFIIKELKRTCLKEAEAASFYAVHKERSFYKDICQGLASGPIVAMVLEKRNAVSEMRSLIGATNPKDALPGTIRYEFGKSIEQNAIHASDTVETAKVEINFLFPDFNVSG